MTFGHSQSDSKLLTIKDPRMAYLHGQWQQSRPWGRFASLQARGTATTSGYRYHSGTMFAIPYKTGARPAPKETTKTPASEYGGQFQEKRFCYSSMDNKPLELYDPNAYRSRNAVSDLKVVNPSSSAVVFDQGLFVSKKRQFATTHKNCYKGMPQDPITNGGILADKYRKETFFKNL